MADETTTRQDPVEAWNAFLRQSLGGQPATWIPSRGQDGGQQDPWSEMIHRLWEANPYSRLLPVDPGEVVRTFQQIWLDAAKNPTRAWTSYAELVQGYTQIMAASTLKLWGADGGTPPVARPESGDRRFEGPDWERSAVFDAIKQTYLLTATTMLRTAVEVEGLDKQQQRKLIFYLRQFLDAISPTNFAFTNPQVIHEAVSSGGRSLAKGTENLLRDLAAGQLTMTDTQAFAPGKNLAVTPGQVVYRNKLIELIQYAPSTDTVHAVPLLLIPPWINKYYILDLRPDNSLVRYMVEQGFTVFVVSWKNPDASMEDTTFEDYLDLGPLAAMQVAKEIAGSAKVNLVGYCVGGTLLGIALAYLAAKRDRSIGSATFFVSLHDFAEVGDTAVFTDEPTIEYIEEQMLERGYLDSRQMATMFNMLRANDLIWSNVVNNYLLGKEPPAFDLLYWNADGTRMTRAAHSYYLRNTYLENNLVKPGKLVLKDVPIDLGRIKLDIYAVGTEQDHIVPWQSAWRISQLTNGNVRFVLGGSGHIAGVISPPGKKSRGWRTNDNPVESAEAWLAGSEQHDGSWWPDWAEWLRPRSGKRVPPPPLGGEKYPPLAAAPGTYVLEK